MIRLLTRLFSGRIHFPKLYTEKILSMDDGRGFRVFRDLKVAPKKASPHAPAVFKVRFKFSSLSLRFNKRLSMIPAPFLLAKSGFREKIWAVSEDGYFQGIYQWASEEDAKTYPQSFIFKLMTKRAAQGTVSFEVIPDTLLSDYINGQIGTIEEN